MQYEEFGTCDTCHAPVTLENRHHAGVWVRHKQSAENPRLNIFHGRRFCSAYCRDQWYTFGFRPAWQIDSPASLNHYACHFCRPVEAWSHLIATGEIRTTDLGPAIEVKNKNNRTIDIVKVVPRTAPRPCVKCQDSGTLSYTPWFFYSAPELLDWNEEWATTAAAAFDRDFWAIVWQADGDEAKDLFRVVIDGLDRRLSEVSDEEILAAQPLQTYMPSHLVKEMWNFDNPIQFNQWWSRSICQAETLEAFSLLKAA